MTWTKLDDSFLGDPKFRRVGPHAELAFTRSLVYGNRYLTDGFIADEDVRDLCQGFEREAPRIAAALVRVGLWKRCPGGYKVKNFLRYQDSKAVVMTRRKSNAERQRRHRDRQGSPEVDVESNAVSNALRAHHPDPARPDPSRTRDFLKRRTGGAGGPLQPAIEHLAAKMRMPS